MNLIINNLRISSLFLFMLVEFVLIFSILDSPKEAVALTTTISPYNSGSIYYEDTNATYTYFQNLIIGYEDTAANNFWYRGFTSFNIY